MSVRLGLNNSNYKEAENIEEQNSITNTLTKTFWATVSPFDPFISFFITQPLADALALKTYTHGTNFKNYLNIRCFGANPAKGGNMSGSTAGLMALTDQEDKKAGKRELEDCKGYFYLFKDVSDISTNDVFYEMNNKPIKFEHGNMRLKSAPDAKNREYIGENGTMVEAGVTTIVQYECKVTSNGTEFITINGSSVSPICILGTHPASSEKYFLRSALPMRHAILSSMASWTTRGEKGCAAMLKRTFGVISGILTPTISVRAAEGDPFISQLETDPDFPSVAYRIKQVIPTNYIGLSGIVHQGMKGNPIQRISDSPTKALLGMARLSAFAFTVFMLIPKRS